MSSLLNSRSNEVLERRRTKLDLYLSAVVNTNFFQTKTLALFLDPMLEEVDVVSL